MQVAVSILLLRECLVAQHRGKISCYEEFIITFSSDDTHALESSIIIKNLTGVSSIKMNENTLMQNTFILCLLPY